ncbi:MAG TPA: hypothetical protein PKA37_00570 [Planctomycetota bacterium]|nr:hypothetical protein [Planctomycetota bacterium]
MAKSQHRQLKHEGFASLKLLPRSANLPVASRPGLPWPEPGDNAAHNRKQTGGPHRSSWLGSLGISAALTVALGAGLRAQSPPAFDALGNAGFSLGLRLDVKDLQSSTEVLSLLRTRRDSTVRSDLLKTNMGSTSSRDMELPSPIHPIPLEEKGIRHLFPTTPSSEERRGEDKLQESWVPAAVPTSNSLVDLNRTSRVRFHLGGLREVVGVHQSEEVSMGGAGEPLPTHRRLLFSLNRASLGREECWFLSRAFSSSPSAIRSVAASDPHRTLDESTDRLMAQSLKQSRWLRTRP